MNLSEQKKVWYDKNKEVLRELEKTNIHKAFRNLRLLLKRKNLNISPELTKIIKFNRDLLYSEVQNKKKQILINIYQTKLEELTKN